MGVSGEGGKYHFLKGGRNKYGIVFGPKYRPLRSLDPNVGKNSHSDLHWIRIRMEGTELHTAKCNDEKLVSHLVPLPFAVLADVPQSIVIAP
jgi:hypothetical protein